MLIICELPAAHIQVDARECPCFLCWFFNANCDNLSQDAQVLFIVTYQTDKGIKLIATLIGNVLF